MLYFKEKINDNYECININISNINDNSNKSFGITIIPSLFQYFNLLDKQEQINIFDYLNNINYIKMPILNRKYKLIFQAKANKHLDKFKFKIFNGIKYIIIDKPVSIVYDTYEIISDFIFTESSLPRIGFHQLTNDIIINIYNPEIVCVSDI